MRKEGARHWPTAQISPRIFRRILTGLPLPCAVETGGGWPAGHIWTSPSAPSQSKRNGSEVTRGGGGGGGVSLDTLKKIEKMKENQKECAWVPQWSAFRVPVPLTIKKMFCMII